MSTRLRRSLGLLEGVGGGGGGLEVNRHHALYTTYGVTSYQYLK